MNTVYKTIKTWILLFVVIDADQHNCHSPNIYKEARKMNVPIL